MESLLCRFRGGRVVGEAVLVLVFGITGGAVLGEILDPLRRFSAVSPGFLAALTFLFAALGLLGWGRWRSRFLIDDHGVEYRRSRTRVVTRLDWEEIDEIFLLGPSEFEIRGAGKRIRLSGSYDGVGFARERCVPRLSGIRDHLRTQALQKGEVVFRMPSGRWKAHLAYLAAVLVLTAITGLCLAPLFKRRIFSFPVVLVFFASGWLWRLRKRASGLGTQVTLRREGFVVRRLDGKDRVAWPDFDHSEWNDKEGLDLLLRSKRIISLPPSLGNLVMLEEFLREGPPSIDSGTPEGAEGRTMMQSP